MENQITKEHQIVGKTVERIELTFSGWLGLRFTDGTFIVFATQNNYDDAADIEVQAADANLEQLRDLEIITCDDYKARIDAQRAIDEGQRLLHERREYERLAKKFGEAAQPDAATTEPTTR